MPSISQPADGAVCIRHNNCRMRGREEGAAETDRQREMEKGGMVRENNKEGRTQEDGQTATEKDCRGD